MQPPAAPAAPVAAPAGRSDRRVLWTMRSRQPLRGTFPARLDPSEIDALLLRTFPGRDVVVLECLLGFRVRDDRLILLVEAVDPDGRGHGSHVVKVGLGARVVAEYRAWRSATAHRPGRQPLDSHVLLELGMGHPGDPDQRADYASIVYANARERIREGENRTFANLESAVLSAVYFGCPAVAGDESVRAALRPGRGRAAVERVVGSGSVRAVVRELFKWLHADLYSRADTRPLLPVVTAARGRPDAPRPPFESVTNLDQITEAMGLWREERFREARTVAERAAPPARGAAPLRALPLVRFVIDLSVRSAARRTPRRRRGPGRGLESFPAPGVTVGPAHGDLHGRNVYVGVTEERVNRRPVDSPTVFDYGNMGPANLVALDFVKLETELKVRAYDLVFPCDPAAPDEFARRVHQFEEQLALDAEAYSESGTLPDHDDTPAGRLRGVLFEVRAEACRSLDGRRRGPDWLDEYYLILAAYSVLPSRFPDYRQNLSYRLAVAVAGDVAAARVSWAADRWRREFDAVAALAREPDVAAAEGEATEWFSRRLLGSDALFDLTRRWWSRGREAELRAAGRLLDHLNRDCGADQDLWQQHILVYMETDPAAAGELVARAEQQFREPDEELGGRFGRARKELGDEYLRRGDLERAREEYERAAAHYGSAYARRCGPYPGVNVAALHLLLAATHPAGSRDRARERDEAREFAGRLLANRRNWPGGHPDDPDVWHPACIADCHLLRREWARAAALYRTIPARPGQLRSIGRQVRRIVDAWRAIGVQLPEPLASFDPDAPEPLFLARRP